MRLRDPDMPTPAEQLTGRFLDGGWKVLSRFQRPPGATGGCFSQGYVVQSPHGRKAYLKALDYHRGFTPGVDPAMVLAAMTTAFNHERDLCVRCQKRSLSHVVEIITDGHVWIDPTDPFSVVQYLIFEHAAGDMRASMDAGATLDLAWGLRVLHNVAVGLQELHGLDIVHQDLKPSNVLTFSRVESKIADLGHAATRSTPSPLEGSDIAADPAYAPLEQCYRFRQPDDYRHRLAGDMYLLGSLTAFIFTKVGMTALLVSHLNDNFHWRRWGGTYTDVLPYLKVAFAAVLTVCNKAMPVTCADELTRILSYLCEPDPLLRGDPSDRVGHRNPYTLERFISRFDRMAKRAECRLMDSQHVSIYRRS